MKWLVCDDVLGPCSHGKTSGCSECLVAGEALVEYIKARGGRVGMIQLPYREGDLLAEFERGKPDDTWGSKP